MINTELVILLSSLAEVSRDEGEYTDKKKYCLVGFLLGLVAGSWEFTILLFLRTLHTYYINVSNSMLKI